MREVVLVTAEWCGACKGIAEWFTDSVIPDVTFIVRDISEVDYFVINTVPVFLFYENGNIIDTHNGTIYKHNLIKRIHDLWPEKCPA